MDIWTATHFENVVKMFEVKRDFDFAPLELSVQKLLREDHGIRMDYSTIGLKH